MIRMRTIPLLVAAISLVSAGCRRSEAPRVETKAETKSTNPDGSKTTTTTETRQVGSTLASTTETTVGGPNRAKTEDETVVGTVTELTVGKRLVILTGDGEKHSYDLDDKTVAAIDRAVTVGTKVRLDSTKDNEGRRSVRVAPVRDR